jgi:hypothetical protein
MATITQGVVDDLIGEIAVAAGAIATCSAVSGKPLELVDPDAFYPLHGPHGFANDVRQLPHELHFHLHGDLLNTEDIGGLIDGLLAFRLDREAPLIGVSSQLDRLGVTPCLDLEFLRFGLAMIRTESARSSAACFSASAAIVRLMACFSAASRAFTNSTSFTRSAMAMSLTV